MIAYGFDQDGFYTGEVKRQLSQLEPGVWLLPAQATDVAPPVVEDGFRARWNGLSWRIVQIPPPPQQPEEETYENVEESL